MHQEPARAQRVFVEDVALLIGRDVHLADEKLAVFDLAPCLLEAEVSQTDGFDLGAGKLNAGFKFFFDEIFVVRLLVFCHDFDAGCSHAGTSFHPLQYHYITPVKPLHLPGGTSCLFRKRGCVCLSFML